MQGTWPMLPQGLQMVGGGVPFMPRQAVLGIDCVPFLHARITMGFSQNGSSGNRHAPGISVNQGFLLDQNIQFDSVQEQIIGKNRKLIEGRGHGLAAGLINVPGINALRIDLRDRPRQRVLANSRRKLPAALCHQFLGIVQAHDAPLGIQNDRGGDHWAEQRATTGFIETSDAQPPEFARCAFETRATKATHADGPILARKGRSAARKRTVLKLFFGTLINSEIEINVL
jgi:hypothetical protein